jgi:glycosyltransferase involved in cell wall biosynthesis
VPAKSSIKPEYDLPFQVNTVGNLRGHLWEQIDLPKAQKTMGNPLLLNLSSTSPIFTNNQIVSHHDITYIKHPEAYAWSFIVLYRFLVPRFLRHSRAVITVSEFSKQEISSFWNIPPDKFTVVQCAAGRIFTPDIQLKTEAMPYFLAVASHAAHKNLAFLIDAFLKLKTECHLKIVGGGSNSFSYHQYTVSDPRIEFLGRVDDDIMLSLLRGAKALVFPSLYEGFGIPPLEAQACGTPVIASNIPTTREVLMNSAEFFDPYNIESLMLAMEKIDRDIKLCYRLSKAGIENAKRYSWRISAKLVSDLIDTVL